jgi:RNA polymerase sigma-70 factor (ECF subfamily)
MLKIADQQNDASGHATLAEAARALACLPAADLKRAGLIARGRANGLRALGWEDLLHEAVLRILDGTRRWPRDVPMIALLAQTMRSIASDTRRREFVEADEAERPVTAAQDNLEDALDASGRLMRVETRFAQDAGALALMEGLQRGETALETQHRTGMTPRAYDAARKRFWRGVAALDGDKA